MLHIKVHDIYGTQATL